MDTNCELRDAGQLTRLLWQGSPALYIAIHDPTERNQHGDPHWCAPGMAGHWNFSHLAAPVLEVSVFTTCDEVELFLNGEPVDRKSKEEYPRDYRHAIVPFFVPNAPGTLHAAGYIAGEKVAEQRYETADEPSRVSMVAERETVTANGVDVIPIRVAVEDSTGRPCPKAEVPLTFEADAPGNILATDAGDLTDHEPYTAKKRNSFRGLCYCYVVASAPGAFDVRVSSPGIEGHSVTFTATTAAGE